MALVSIICRPFIGLEMHAQREREFGRFENQNLLTLSWAEKYFLNCRETKLETLHSLFQQLTSHNPYLKIS